MDPFFQIFVFLMLVFVSYFSISGLRKLIFGQKIRASEEWTATHMQHLVPVSLSREAGKKFGLGVWTASGGGLKVTGIDKDGLLHEWNESASQEHGCRIAEGDRIIFASGVVDGVPIKTQSAKEMVKVLQGKEASIIVEQQTDKHKMMRITGVCKLEGMTLQGNVELKENRGMTTDFEVVKVGRRIRQWNREMKRKGACCTQSLEVGDRIISVNGNMDIANQLEVFEPCLLIVRWRKASNITGKRVEVCLDRLRPHDHWGLQMRQRTVEPKQMEVSVVMKTGLLEKWNGSVGNKGVFVGDRIVQANEASDNTAISNELKRLGVFNMKLVVERWVDSTANHSDDLFTTARRRASLANTAAYTIEHSLCTSDTEEEEEPDKETPSSGKAVHFFIGEENDAVVEPHNEPTPEKTTSKRKDQALDRTMHHVEEAALQREREAREQELRNKIQDLEDALSQKDIRHAALERELKRQVDDLEARLSEKEEMAKLQKQVPESPEKELAESVRELEAVLIRSSDEQAQEDRIRYLEGHVRELDVLVRQKDALLTQKDLLVTQKDTLIANKDVVLAQILRERPGFLGAIAGLVAPTATDELSLKRLVEVPAYL